MGLLGMMLVTALGAGCEKDTDCKGDRVCEKGVCVAPTPVTAPPPPPMPPPQDTKRVPLGGNSDSPVPPPLPPPDENKRVPLGDAPVADPCADPLDADGRLKAECRVAPNAPQPPLRSRKHRRVSDAESPAATEEESLARGVGLLGVMIGALFGAGESLPVFVFTGAGGVRFRSGVGIVGVLHGRVTLASGGSIQLYSLGPGIRFGNRTQITIATTGTFAVVNVGALSASGAAFFTLLAQIAFVIGDHFSFLIAPTIDLGGSAVLGSISGGLGITF